MEQFSFIMQMKDLVKFQLSMRKIALLYNYVEPKLPLKAQEDEELQDSSQVQVQKEVEMGLMSKTKPQIDQDS